MEGMKRANRFIGLDLVKSVGVFWIVIIIVSIASYIGNFALKNVYIGLSYGLHDGSLGIKTISVAAANIMPIIIYFIAYIYAMYYENFPVALAFSITRKDFYKSLIICNVLIAFIFALVQSILLKIDIKIINSIGRNPYLDFGIYNTSLDKLFYIIFSLFIVFAVLISILNLLAALNYRFGFKLWIVIGIVFFLSAAFIGASISMFFEELFTTRIDTLQLVILGVIMIFSYSIGYIIVTNTNIKNKIS